MTLSDIDFPTPGKGDDFRMVREILDLVGDKWSLYVIAMLKDGPVRFNELRRQIDGISQRMLTITLRGLERDGLVKRTLFPTIPPRVDYELTKVGRTLLAPVTGIVTWANTNQGTSETLASDMTQAKACGDNFEPVSGGGELDHAEMPGLSPFRQRMKMTSEMRVRLVTPTCKTTEASR